jgi:hypothetical protein
MSNKRGREAASSAANDTADESSDDETTSMTLSAFEHATQELFEAQERATKDGRGYVIPARDDVVKWCKKKNKTVVTVKILELLAGNISGMPRFHATKKKPNGRKEDGSVLKSFKELVTAGLV